MMMFWLLFLWPMLGVLSPYRLTHGGQRLVWFVIGLFFAVVMGLRYEVGGDWGHYLPQFQIASRLSFSDASSIGDPGYWVLNWLVAQLGGSIFLVNFICAAVLMWGTVVFCRRQPNPWLALLAAVPYMLIVVGMGYTRQSVALGFALLGLTALGQGRTRAFVFWVVVGALFHKSAVLLLPIAALAASRNRILTGALVLAVTALMYYLLVEDSTERLWTSYVTEQMQSQGATIRVAMNVVPALLLLLFRQRLVSDPQERKLWLWIAVFALLCIPLVGMASTAVDRVALYLIPLQLYVFARLPRLARTMAIHTTLVLGIVVYYAAVLFVWLNYADHAHFWVPYHFMPMGD